MRIVFALFALLVSLSAGPVMAQKKPVKAPVKRNYVRRGLGFAFNPPPGWLESTRDATPNTVVSFDRRGDDIFKGTVVFLGTITVTAQNAPVSSARNTPLPSLPPNFAEVMDAEYKKVMPEYVYSGTAKFKVAGEEATSIAFQVRDPRMDVLVRVRHVWVLHDKRLWTFALKAKLDEFDRYVEEFDKMMASIVWLPRKQP